MGGDVQAETWVGGALASIGHGLWKTQRAVRDSVSAVSNFAVPDTYSGKNGKLTCPPGMKIARITFAGFGTPEGSCGEMRRGRCDAGPRALAVAEKKCLWKRSCQVRPWGSSGESLFNLSSSACNEARESDGGLSPALMMEATCTQVSENVLEKMVETRPKLDALSLELAPPLTTAVTAARGSGLSPAKVVDDVCRDCESTLYYVDGETDAFQSVCPADSSPTLKVPGMCPVAAVVAKADFLNGYIGDVEMSYGSSIFGNMNAARREVCKDIHLCGFNENAVVGALYPADTGASGGSAGSLRHELLASYSTVSDATLVGDQDAMCDACVHHLSPHMVFVDVWDHDVWFKTQIINKKGSLKAVSDTYLGGIYLDIGKARAEGRTSGNYLQNGLALEHDMDHDMVTNVTGRVFLSWSLDANDRLTVLVERAAGLAAGDITGYSDPYAKVTVVGAKCVYWTGCYKRTTRIGQKLARSRSSYVSTTLNPTWKATFKFDLLPEDSPGALPTSGQGRIFAESVGEAESSIELTHLRRAFGSRVACVHLGMCEYLTSLKRKFDLGHTNMFGAKHYGIRKELKMKSDIDARFDAIMEQINTYPCRSVFVPKNLLLMFSTWRNLKAISKTMFRMRHLVDPDYMAYVRNRNQQVLRGLFYSDVMASVPSYLRGLLEGAVESMLTGKRISWLTFMKKITVAFKRFTLGMAGKVIMAPIMLAVSLLRLVAEGGKAIFYDFLYKFLYKGVKEGKSAEELWREAKHWVKTKSKESYTAVKEAILGSDRCSNTEAGIPSYVTGEDAKRVFAVGETPLNSSHSLLELEDGVEEEVDVENYVSTGSHCGGALDAQQFAVYDSASNGMSMSEIQSQNDYIYIGTCYRSEVEYTYGYSCLHCFNCGPDSSCCFCGYWRTIQVPYPCEKVGHYVSSAKYGNGWDFSRQWHESKIFSHAQANPGASACEIHEMVQQDANAEAEQKQKEYEETMQRALLILMYIAIAIYVVVYLVCVGNSFPSKRMITRKTGRAGAMVLRGALGCTLWPVTFSWMARLAAADEDKLPDQNRFGPYGYGDQKVAQYGYDY